MKRRRYPQPYGQELLEYALILPLFVFMMMGMLDLGRAVYYYSAIFNAAREGARYGSVHPDETDVEASICSQVTDWAVDLGLTCANVATAFDLVAGTVEVTVSYSFTPVTPLVQVLLGSPSILLTTSSIMQLEFIP